MRGRITLLPFVIFVVVATSGFLASASPLDNHALFVENAVVCRSRPTPLSVV